MASTRPKLLATAALFFLLLTGFALVLVWPPTSRVNPVLFGRIEIGLTESHVLEILGKPDPSPGHFIEFPADGFERTWLGQGEFIAIAFDQNGLVYDTVLGEFLHTGTPDSFVDKVRRWLGL